MLIDDDASGIKSPLSSDKQLISSVRESLMQPSDTHVDLVVDRFEDQARLDACRESDDVDNALIAFDSLLQQDSLNHTIKFRDSELRNMSAADLEAEVDQIMQPQMIENGPTFRQD